MALGASRRRVIRQILTESVLLSLIGGIAGLAIAYAGSYMMLTLAFPTAKNMPVQAVPSPVVLGFTFLVSLLTGVVFGTAPAWLSSHAQPADALRGINRSTGDRSLHRNALTSSFGWPFDGLADWRIAHDQIAPQSGAAELWNCH
jgi:predicted lysophospholipase L1 biosynthesis ABC-type transport system permease subunit